MSQHTHSERPQCHQRLHSYKYTLLPLNYDYYTSRVVTCPCVVIICRFIHFTRQVFPYFFFLSCTQLLFYSFRRWCVCVAQKEKDFSNFSFFLFPTNRGSKKKHRKTVGRESEKNPGFPSSQQYKFSTLIRENLIATSRLYGCHHSA